MLMRPNLAPMCIRLIAPVYMYADMTPGVIPIIVGHMDILTRTTDSAGDIITIIIGHGDGRQNGHRAGLTTKGVSPA